MRLTKTICENAAKALLADRREDFKKQEESFREYVYTLVMSYMPTHIVRVMENDSDFLRVRKSIRFKTDGKCEYDYISTSKGVPNPENYLHISLSDYDHLFREKARVERVGNQISIDEDNLVEAMLRYTTRKKLIEAMPELEKIIPDETRVAVLPDPDYIRNLIKK